MVYWVNQAQTPHTPPTFMVSALQCAVNRVVNKQFLFCVSRTRAVSDIGIRIACEYK